MGSSAGSIGLIRIYTVYGYATIFGIYGRLPADIIKSPPSGIVPRGTRGTEMESTMSKKSTSRVTFTALYGKKNAVCAPRFNNFSGVLTVAAKCAAIDAVANDIKVDRAAARGIIRASADSIHGAKSISRLASAAESAVICAVKSYTARDIRDEINTDIYRLFFDTAARDTSLYAVYQNRIQDNDFDGFCRQVAAITLGYFSADAKAGQAVGGAVIENIARVLWDVKIRRRGGFAVNGAKIVTGKFAALLFDALRSRATVSAEMVATFSDEYTARVDGDAAEIVSVEKYLADICQQKITAEAVKKLITAANYPSDADDDDKHKLTSAESAARKVLPAWRGDDDVAELSDIVNAAGDVEPAVNSSEFRAAVAAYIAGMNEIGAY